MYYTIKQALTRHMPTLRKSVVQVREQLTMVKGHR